MTSHNFAPAPGPVALWLGRITEGGLIFWEADLLSLLVLISIVYLWGVQHSLLDPLATHYLIILDFLTASLLSSFSSFTSLNLPFFFSNFLVFSPDYTIGSSSDLRSTVS